MSIGRAASLGSTGVSAPDEPGPGGSGARPEDSWGDEDGPFYAWLPPEDRLWLHPSEAAHPASPRPVPHRRVGPLGGSTVAVAVVAGIIGALVATGVGVASGMWPRDTTVVRPAVESTSEISMADVGAAPVDWTSVVDSVEPSVVAVSVQGGAGDIQGSGLVVMAAGGKAYVVTDDSLLSADLGAGYLGRIQVTFLAGQTYTARLIGQDPLSGLAVLATGDPSDLVAADFGTIADLEEAASVVAVGSRAVPTVSLGSVSAEDRAVEMTDGSTLDDMLAITMPAPGASADGGPVLDQYGQVVGVTLGLQPADQADQQFTFAVPADEVARVATEIIEGQRVTHPWLGISDASDVPSAMAHSLGVPGGVQAGIVDTGSPAAAAGLHSDDVLVSFAGKPVDSVGALVAALNSTDPGRRVSITYVHDGRTYSAQVTLANEPPTG